MQLELIQWIIGVLLAVIGFLISRLIKRFDLVIDGLNKVNETVATHQTRLDNQDERFVQTDSRLNDHGKRLREIEINCAKCNRETNN